MEKLNYKARAKINLALDVCRRLENGYHEIKTVMQSVNIYDELEFKRRRDPDIILSVDSRYELGDLGNNLIFRAAKFMKEYYGIRQGIEIHLKKTIPVAAGMAGGSTDAAATMLAMNEMFALKLDKEELMRQGLRLGADIPFCILGGTALAEGVGEKLTPLPAPPRASLLVVKPPIMVSTKRVYETLRVNQIAKHPDIDGMMAALEQGDIERVANYLENVMEAVTVKENSIIAEIKTMMTQQGAYNALMSGSGPSVFGIFAKEEEAQAAAKHIRSALKAKKMASQVFVTEFYNPF
ncbi:MAG: 4-(cytidine 5'-diphospho)-2-C-methyl-D-erythritol kinase [Lachnospiraceae bacterium]|jgi:4-diphosphocytidyl-2C-methyl-D-erythritol kinase|nr:4-(cytidine 5'-diphospho)-2-C-methyl-D-erythritol kinase [Lachnospiraceae bacterium]MCI9401326.1 4-(cytidine 5'-diphospho)-2-C-methyl-D-erythritol kinase [Lachnospiraceae bacterium]MCX4376441.1 4-(cytidine 5'-diphospho)-2-C-methyl-D-erythritol kinase [Lachnospiraceae bacterium]